MLGHSLSPSLLVDWWAVVDQKIWSEKWDQKPPQAPPIPHSVFSWWCTLVIFFSVIPLTHPIVILSLSSHHLLSLFDPFHHSSLPLSICSGDCDQFPSSSSSFFNHRSSWSVCSWVHPHHFNHITGPPHPYIRRKKSNAVVNISCMHLWSK